MRPLTPLLSVLALLGAAAMPATAQLVTPPPVLPPHVRHSTPLFGRQPPISYFPAPLGLTADQQAAVAPVKYPMVWPAPQVAPGTVLPVPPRPNWLPGPGQYWGPFTNDLGGWGFMVGPLPAPPPPPPSPFFGAFPVIVPTRFGTGILAPPPAAPAPPPPPVLPVAGPISPDGRMVVRYPDGNSVTWQFPMVDYVGAWNGIGPGGGFRFILDTGRRPTFGIAGNARFTLNGQPVDPHQVAIGTRVVARALRFAPALLTVVAFSR